MKTQQLKLFQTAPEPKAAPVWRPESVVCNLVFAGQRSYEQQRREQEEGVPQLLEIFEMALVFKR